MKRLTLLGKYSLWVHPKYTKPSAEYKLRSQDSVCMNRHIHKTLLLGRNYESSSSYPHQFCKQEYGSCRAKLLHESQVYLVSTDLQLSLELCITDWELKLPSIIVPRQCLWHCSHSARLQLNRQQSYKICLLWSHIGWIINGCFNVIFATDIQPITVRKIITFVTESCFPEAYCDYCHHKCPMGCVHLSPYMWLDDGNSLIILWDSVSGVYAPCSLQHL